MRRRLSPPSSDSWHSSILLSAEYFWSILWTLMVRSSSLRSSSNFKGETLESCGLGLGVDKKKMSVRDDRLSGDSVEGVDVFFVAHGRVFSQCIVRL